ncbi:PREDICTED: CBL-interacting serine/threonine-protein kinase 7-like [Ipomoea nil]|uniref:CBL-interacting serine/threonine-protein kinase 7-like n=1 Tax=Ipomoea nil TaxID=35883 RepID=UPI0009018F03|nr:PREDICTED: CBL-interacting serine/threonine-protein kinase 7-like [Ipomoea nil]
MDAGREKGGGKTIILKKYELCRLLGRGSFAKVYHGRRLEDNADVAVKVIDKKATVAAVEPYILREILAMRRLNHHPNIVKLHEVMATKTKIYLVMELAKGGDLLTKLGGGRFDNSTARRYFRELISALSFCHQNGVAHRDIKPQNLLLDGDGNLKISDFGLSALLSEHLKDVFLETTCGTLEYTAPEVMTRQRYDGAKADAWSCGVLLFEFLAGRRPFEGRNTSEMFRAISRREFRFPSAASKPARKIIHRLLDPDPVTRPTIEELMIKHPWFKKSSPPALEQVALPDHKECKNIRTMNAFDIISMSSGLDLSGLFEAEMKEKRMRFTLTAEVGEIEERVKKMGFGVERGKGGEICRLVKGGVVLILEILRVSTEIWLGEIKVVNGGKEFEEFKVGLTDIVSWHSDGALQ